MKNRIIEFNGIKKDACGMNFKCYLLNESKHYLGQRSGDILTALQNLQEDAPSMGNRALVRACQGIVNQIRRILHGRWDDEDIKYLKQLQKVGVAIMKTIEENEDIQQIISSGVQELESMLDKLQVPINSLGTEGKEVGDDDMHDEGGKQSQQEDEPLPKGSEMGA